MSCQELPILRLGFCVVTVDSAPSDFVSCVSFVGLSRHPQAGSLRLGENEGGESNQSRVAPPHKSTKLYKHCGMLSRGAHRTCKWPCGVVFQQEPYMIL